VALVFLFAGMGCFSGRSQAPGVITGFVYNDATGEGIPGADVVLVPSEIAVQTGADGSFRFENVPGGSYTIRVNAPGYQNGAATGVDVSPGKVKWAKLFLKRPPQRGSG
jgi:iron complex outermembrane receptor protein